MTDPVIELVTGDLNGNEAVYTVGDSNPDLPDYDPNESVGVSSGYISADGLYVVFDSNAQNITANSPEDTVETYVRDLRAGVTTLVSVAADGTTALGDGDGAKEASSSGGVANNGNASVLLFGDPFGLGEVRQIYRTDLGGGYVIASDNATDQLGHNPALGQIPGPITPDGRYVLFTSDAENLTGDSNDLHGELFRKDLDTGALQIVSETKDGTLAGSLVLAQDSGISTDGRYVAFDDYSDELRPDGVQPTGLVGSEVYVKDLQTGDLTLVSTNLQGDGYFKGISADGTKVLYEDIPTISSGQPTTYYLKDLTSGTITSVLTEDANTTYDVQLAADGEHVAIQANFFNPDGSGATGYAIFEQDLVTGALTTVQTLTPSNDGNVLLLELQAISEDGHYILYDESGAKAYASNSDPNLFYHQNELYVADLRPPTITIGSVAGDDILDTGEQAFYQSSGFDVSGTTTDVEAGNTVTVTLEGTDKNAQSLIRTYTGTVGADGSWTVHIGGADEAALGLGSQTLLASVKDNGGTEGDTNKEFNVAVRQPPSIGLDKISGDNVITASEQTALAATGLVISGSTQNVEQGQTVTIDFNGHIYHATVGAGGTWSTTVAAGDVDPAHLAEGYYALEASVDNAVAQATHASETVRVGTPVYLFPFSLNDGSAFGDAELWMTKTGGAGSAELVLNADPARSNNNEVALNNSALAGNKLFFVANNGTDGYALWTSDGTASGTHEVKDINLNLSGPPGGGTQADPFLGDLVAAGDKVFFIASDGQPTPNDNEQLWVSDGTAAGTVKLTDSHMFSDGLFSKLVPVGDKLYYVDNDGTHGLELWVTDGQVGAAHTHMVADINTGGDAFFDANLNFQLTDVNGTAYFLANSAAGNNELWKTDGTEAGTALVSGEYVISFAPIGGKIVFVDGNDQSLRATDGTTTTTIAGGSVYSLSDVTDVGGTAYFVKSGLGVYASDAGLNGSHLVKSFTSMSSPPANLTAVGDKLFFTADDGTHGRELWVTDSSGTHMLEINPSGDAFAYASAADQPMTVFNGKVLFTAFDGQHEGVWISDGVTAKKLADINASAFSAGVPLYGAFVDADAVYFTAYDGTSSDIWVTDGTPGGTHAITSNVDGIPFGGIFPVFAPGGDGGGGGGAVQAHDDSASVNEFKTISGNVLKNDAGTHHKTFAVSAVDGSAVAVNKNLSGDYGILHLKANGGYTYTATDAQAIAAGTQVHDSFTYTVSDGHGGTGTATLSITVTASANGTAGNDHLLANPGGSTLSGLKGIDFLEGQGGDDILIGGPKQDTLTGGAGHDTFVFKRTTDSGLGIKHDVITDFSEADLDKIDLFSIDADIHAKGNQAFHFVDANPGDPTDFSESFAAYHADHPRHGKLPPSAWYGVLRFADGLLQGDVNGDGKADFEIALSGVAHLDPISDLRL